MNNLFPFRAIWVEETQSQHFSQRVVERKIADLPAGEVLVKVEYSSLNYKDALSFSGNRGVTKRYPHTPGIDAAGTVEVSSNPNFEPGDQVISVCTGDLGVNTPGGFGQFIQVPGTWLVHLPSGLSLFDCMAYGTAGFTAAMCLQRFIREGSTPEKGEVLVTGASGGVGSLAVGLFAKAGFQVVAVTGKLQARELLKTLGASQVLGRDEVTEPGGGKALLHSRWAGVVDTVGGNILSAAVRSCLPGGLVLSCGNAASPDLPLTVYPFILRGVTLAGIDASRPSQADRVWFWHKLAGEWKLIMPHGLVKEVSFEGVIPEIERMLKGSLIGRVVLNLK